MPKRHDEDEFRRAVADVAPLAPLPRRAPRGERPAPVARQSRRDEEEALRESLTGPLSLDDALEAGDELAYLRDGYSRQLLRRLRRGDWAIQEHIDLHGLNRADAVDAVAAFLRSCAARGLRCVRIVHGKGRGSKNREPVLKHLMRKLLPRRDEVLGFCQAPATQGGGGALLVLLKPGR